MSPTVITTVGLALLLLTASPARSENADEWVALGTRVHGAFGTFIPLGIRIGEDALRRLGAGRGGVYGGYSNGAAPGACGGGGIGLATQASVGQGTLQVTTEKSPAGTLGVAVIRDKKSGKGLRYAIPAALLPELLQWNKDFDPLGRYRMVMDAPEPFQVTEVGTEAGAP